MGKKKVFVRPRPKGKKRTEEEKDALLVKKVERLVCQVAKKVKAFEAQHITRNLKQHRQKFENSIKDASDPKVIEAKKSQFEKTELKMNESLQRVKSLDAKQFIVPRALQKLGIGKEYDWVGKDHSLKSTTVALENSKGGGSKRKLNEEKDSKNEEDDEEDDEEVEGNSANSDSDDDSLVLGMANMNSDSEDEEEEREEVGEKGISEEEEDEEEEDDGEGDDDDKDDEEDASDESSAPSEKEEPKEVDPRITDLVEKLLKHNAMVSALDTLSESVTERRREKLAIFEGIKPTRKMKKKQAQAEGMFSYSDAPQVNHRNARTTFLTSLSGVDYEMGGEDSDEEEGVVQQKNRPGQRARQARHEKEQARKEKKERIKKLKEAGIVIDPNHKEKQREKWAKEQKEREKEYYKRQRESESLNQYQKDSGYGGGDGRASKVSRTGKHGEAAAASSATIHSSWEAAKIRKEKEKEIMSLPFQGKKKVFGDNEDYDIPPPPPPPPPATRPANRPPASMPSKKPAPSGGTSKLAPNARQPGAASVGQGEEAVHPSWAAKQAQAAKLAGGFQGKKIKFNTDDD